MLLAEVRGERYMARRQKYKFAKKQYAKNGKYSALIAGASFVILIFSVLLSFLILLIKFKANFSATNS